MNPGPDPTLRDALGALLPGEPVETTVLARLVDHLERVLERNRVMNLTSITDPREALIKHVVDSLMPASHFASAESFLDLGSGAGFPGIPLALLAPDRPVLLTESRQKKARFLAEVVAELNLPRVRVRAERAEEVIRERGVDLIVARAAGRTDKVLAHLAPHRRRFQRLVFYKGPAGEQELGELAPLTKELGFVGEVIGGYQLPENHGRRCLVEYRPV